jgi:hypothetical protein
LTTAIIVVAIIATYKVWYRIENCIKHKTSDSSTALCLALAPAFSSSLRSVVWAMMDSSVGGAGLIERRFKLSGNCKSCIAVLPLTEAGKPLAA